MRQYMTKDLPVAEPSTRQHRTKDHLSTCCRAQSHGDQHEAVQDKRPTCSRAQPQGDQHEEEEDREELWHHVKLGQGRWVAEHVGYCFIIKTTFNKKINQHFYFFIARICLHLYLTKASPGPESTTSFTSTPSSGYQQGVDLKRHNPERFSVRQYEEQRGSIFGEAPDIRRTPLHLLTQI